MLDTKFLEKIPAENELINNWHSQEVKVSICCVVFNHGKFLEKALQSFLTQKTDFAFEIVIHDDASTDESQSIILRYAKDYPTIIRPIIQEENIYSKRGKPLSVIFDDARGDYFALCEGDDYWRDCNKLQLQYDAMVNNPKASISYHRSILVKNSQETSDLALPASLYKNYSSSELLSGCAAISTQTVMVTNRLKKLPEEYCNVMNEDSFLFVIAGIYGHGMVIDNVQPAAYRIHDGGVWSQRSIIQKKVRTAESYYWISKYLERQGFKHFANVFRMKAAKTLLFDRKRDFFLLFRSAILKYLSIR